MGGHEASLKDGSFDDPKHVVSGPFVTRVMYSTGIGALVGTFYGAVMTAWYPDPVATIPTSTHLKSIGRTIARPAMWMALIGGVFTGTECMMEYFRNDKKDAWNSLVAGMAGGTMIGMINGRPQVMAATAIWTGVGMAAVTLSGAKTVYDEEMLNKKIYGILPEVHVESPELMALKEKYPKFKDN